jgi:hypothetical protein
MATLTIGQKQRKFTRMIGLLIEFAYSKGYELTFGEAWRPEETAEFYERTGKGISNSLHTKRLAVDFNLFKEGKWLKTTEDHLFLGLYWESIGGTWGGRFKPKPDGNHYSLEHNGVK